MSATAPQARQCWVGVVSREHVRRGVADGFVQLNHGKKAPVQRLRGGDVIAIYSPRTAYPDGEPLQAFTAVGVVRTGEVYQVAMSEDFKPYRVGVRFIEAREAPIKPLIESLTFIKSKTRWGAAFRFGCVKVPGEDFQRIAHAMGIDEAQLEGRG
ncbi:MAG: EVE domain-containing protein [Pseudomonadota bacterium]|nr:EVE domain-containing protein [Pseudomonadota bacterium]